MPLDPMSDSFFKSDQEREQDRAIPFFSIEAVECGLEDGHPKYEDREFCEIRHPGDRTYTYKCQVNEDVKRRFPRHYAAFKEEREAPEFGTPIKMWPVLTPAQVANFMAAGIRSIEDLATMPDSQIHHLGHGGRGYREKAAAWLESAAKGAGAVKAAEDAERLRNELASRDATISDLVARLDALEKKKRAKEDA